MTVSRTMPSAIQHHSGARIGSQFMWISRTVWPVSALLMLAGCNSSDTSVASSSSGSGDSGYKTTGNFACHEGHPWQAVQVSSSADVPAGASAKISVQTPPGLSSALAPDRMYVFCQVDEQRCTGTSCNGSPPVDFIGSHGDGLTWESVRSETGETNTVFTAIVHNSDTKIAHHATLTLDLPAP